MAQEEKGELSADGEGMNSPAQGSATMCHGQCLQQSLMALGIARRIILISYTHKAKVQKRPQIATGQGPPFFTLVALCWTLRNPPVLWKGHGRSQPQRRWAALSQGAEAYLNRTPVYMCGVLNRWDLHLLPGIFPVINRHRLHMLPLCSGLCSGPSCLGY